MPQVIAYSIAGPSCVDGWCDLSNKLLMAWRVFIVTYTFLFRHHHPSLFCSYLLKSSNLKALRNDEIVCVFLLYRTVCRNVDKKQQSNSNKEEIILHDGMWREGGVESVPENNVLC